MNEKQEKTYAVANEIAEAIVNVFAAHDEMSVGSRIYALRTAIISILHCLSPCDKGGGIDYFLDSLRDEYHKLHSLIAQMEAQKGEYN